METLLDRARNGDQEAFAAVFEEFRPLLHRIAFRLVGADECDDVVMDTYLKVWRAVPRFRGSGGVKTWLCRATRNCALDHLRRRQREQGRMAMEDGEEDTPLIDRVADGRTPEPDRKADLNDLKDVLAVALKQLGEEHRTTLILRDVDGLSYREVAAATGVSMGTVMSRLFYARRQVRKILRSMGYEP